MSFVMSCSFRQDAGSSRGQFQSEDVGKNEQKDEDEKKSKRAKMSVKMGVNLLMWKNIAARE